MQQTHLPGFDPPPREVHNLFFALWPDEATRARIAAAADSLRAVAPQGRWIKPHRYHLTLQFLGEYAALPPLLLERAIDAAQRVRVPAFDLALDVVGSFANARIPCWLGCSEVPAGLRTLFDTLGSALRESACRAVGGARLVPHVTVLRDAERSLNAQVSAPVCWRIDEFVLIDSRTQPPAPYRILERWPLR